MDGFDLGWVVALLEGEGTFNWQRRDPLKPRTRPFYARVRVGMTDEDVVRRLHKKTGVGRVTGPISLKNTNHKDQWYWTVSRRQEVVTLCELILPHMGSRRSAKIAEMMAEIKSHEEQMDPSKARAARVRWAA
jgi:hypothetical protein